MCTIARRPCSQVGVVSLGLARCEGPCGLGTELRYFAPLNFLLHWSSGAGGGIESSRSSGEDFSVGRAFLGRFRRSWILAVAGSGHNYVFMASFRASAPRRRTFLAARARQRAISSGRARDHIVRRYDGLLLVRRALNLSGAVSGIMSMAKSPAAPATSMYQAGASALSVRWISQVTTG